LDLGGVEVHGDDVVGAGDGEEVGDEPGKGLALLRELNLPSDKDQAVGRGSRLGVARFGASAPAHPTSGKLPWRPEPCPVHRVCGTSLRQFTVRKPVPAIP
jgi:hypothetical protein